MTSHVTRSGVALALVLLLLGLSASVAAAADLTPKEELGRDLFFDTNLSDPAGQSCATCHGPAVGWTGPDQTINKAGSVYEGAVAGRFGNRKPPAAAYAGDSPILYWDGAKWVGGMFWDGRATGWTLGDPLAEQALGPFLNPLEQNNATPQVVVDKVMASSYSDLFAVVCAANPGVEPYEVIGRSIAAYERSLEVSQFTSKYDYWLKGEVQLTGQERLGLALFRGKAKCGNCHVEPLFTDFTYDNLGIPKNPSNPFYNEPDWNPQGADWVDPGLGGFLQAAGYAETVWGPEWGKHKVPTLRNVDLRPSLFFVKAYGHNGYFKSLWSIVHFYNTRDVRARAKHAWPAPEVALNVNKAEMGDLGLTLGQEIAIVAFMRTLSDGYVPAAAH